MKRGIGLAALVAAFVCALQVSAQDKKGPLYATLKTTMGDIVIHLFDDKAPNTVANFVGLATGTKEWTDLKTGKKVKRPLYNTAPDSSGLFSILCGCDNGMGCRFDVHPSNCCL